MPLNLREREVQMAARAMGLKLIVDRFEGPQTAESATTCARFGTPGVSCVLCRMATTNWQLSRGIRRKPVAARRRRATAHRRERRPTCVTS
jgi:hypothetical protein